ncbi:energy transducer TonB [Roseivirga sp. BDSF3-8]|uniref:energy transducer TonB n=1 Tax=Roseivirga sp. BDSF3-8 TaxID=3241598 RepID=UPI003531957B
MITRLFLIGITLLLTFETYGQTTTYYRDKYRLEKVAEPQARYYEVVTEEDSIRTIEFYRVKGNVLLDVHAYKGNQPFRVWRTYNRKGEEVSSLDYDFDVIYLDEKPDSGMYFSWFNEKYVTDTTGELTRPDIITSEQLAKYLAYTLRYPRQAVRSGTSGKVKLLCRLDASGDEVSIYILNGGVEPHLDKEAARAVRQALNGYKPGHLDGEPIDVYLLHEVVFKLSN